LRALIGRFALIAAGLLLPLLILEAGVRLTRLAPPPEPNPTIWEPHPLFGWWHIPYSGGVFHSDYNEFEAEVRINSRGLRDREIGYDNPDDALRILSLADSFGEALQVDLEQTYHKRLEALLEESLEQPVEVLNAGVGGWGTDQEAIFYLAEGFRYEPDLVLLAFFIRNDAVNNYGPLEIARNGGRQQKQFFALSATGDLIPPPLQETASTDEPDQAVFQQETNHTAPLLGLADGLWQYSAMYRFLVPYLRDIPEVVQAVGPSGLLGGEAIIRANHPTTPVPFFVYHSPPSEEFESAWQLTEAIITGLRDEVAKRGSRLVVVLIAAPEQVYPEAWQTVVAQHSQMQSGSWDLEAPNRRLAGYLESEEIPYLDLLPVFRTATDKPGAPPLHFRHDQHWTAEGHQVAAEALHTFLLDLPE
jgi:hypothetical protein